MAKYTQNTLTQAQELSRQILSEDEIRVQESGLVINSASKGTITLAENTVTERDFIAAEDLYDSSTGNKIYSKGDIILEGTELAGDWQLVDLDDEDVIKDFDPNTGTTSDPSEEDEEEINNGTTETSTGHTRDTDFFIDRDYENRTSWNFGYVSTGEEYALSFSEDDELVCLGHLYDSTRQNAIVLSATNPVDPELEAPAMAQYNYIDTFGVGISQYRMTAIAANGNEFIGSFLVHYNDTYMDINERINLFINDINTGLEAVGIHLDGENSTITLVGSVDLRQHSATSYDTLNVYDNLGTKRVEITPFDIPVRNSVNSGIDITKKYFTYNSTNKTATSSYISYTKWKDWDGPFWYSWVYRYELKNYSVSATTSVDLGYIEAGSVIDLSKLDLHFWSDLYLAGARYISNRGTGQQSITTLNYTLKKNGVALSGRNKVSLLNNANLSINGINTSDVGLAITGTWLDDFSITSSGTYSLEITVAETLYGYITCGTNYNNYYISVSTGFSGNVTLSISKDLSNSNNNNRKLTVGTNGLSFVGNNSRYFYVATDGYELKWDDAALSLDATNGFRVNKLYQVISATTTVQKKYDIVICNYTSGGYSIYLPLAQEFGNGRVLTVIGFKGLKVYTSGTNTVRVPLATSVAEASCIEFGESTVSGSLQMPKYNVQLISANAGWYIISYV